MPVQELIIYNLYKTMKKQLLILLFWVGFLNAQTYQNPTFGNTTTNTLKVKTPSTITSVNFLPAFDVDGITVNKITPININIPYTPINYSISNQSIGQHLTGIDTRLGQVSSTSAGITQRVYFTADNTTVTAGTFFSSSLLGKGSVVAGSPTALTLGDNIKAFFDKDIISIAQPTATLGYAGTYSGNLTVSATPTPNATQQRFTLEVYRCDNGGTPIASGVSGAPTGDLGVTVIAILDSGLINLAAGSISNVPISGTLTQNITINTGQRLRYHVSAQKVGVGGGNVTFGVYYGSSYNSYYDIPVAITTDAVLNKSGVAGVTSSDALNLLNIEKANDANVIHTTLDEIKNGKLGLNTTILDSNVSDLKIGNRVPSDDNNIVAISKDYSAGNAIYNGLNIEIKSTSTVNNDLRVNRALKSVSLVDPNGYTLTNQGGSGMGVEGVSRLQGLGTVKVMTGGYFRVLQDTDNPLAILEVANGVVIPTPGGFSTAPIGTSVGININEQNYLSRSTNSINALIGTANLGGTLPVGLTGKYSIYNVSDEQNYFKYRLGLGITAPSEMLDVVGNGKFSGSVGIGAVSTVSKLNLSGSITGATTAYSIFNQPTVQSDVTSIAYYNRTTASTQAASFTLGSLIHNSATQGTFGAGSTVTNQYGFIASNTLTGATNNYGFRGQIPSNASANWNTYNDGTAPNYFNGNVGIGTLPAVSATDKLQVNGNITASAGTTANHVVTKSQLDSKADLASPTFTGDPKAPTPTAGDNDTSIATTAFVQAVVRPYKSYAIKLSQTGTSNPTVTFTLENTVGSITWTRSSTGVYFATSSGLFGSGTAKCSVSAFFGSFQASGEKILGYSVDSNTCVISTTAANGTVTDGLMSNAFIEIRVYN